MKPGKPLQRKTPMKPGKPMARKSSLQAKPKAKLLRQRLCEACRVVKFRPERDNVTWCSPDCGVTVATQRVAANEARAHRNALANVKPLSHWEAVTERVVNGLVLVRDADKPCISCGTWTTVMWQAGHYLSKGAHPELRFQLLNIHKQCHRCNVALSGNQIQYRIGLVPRIGVEAVEWLEGPHPAAKNTREGLAQIRKEAAAETRRLERERAGQPTLEAA